MGLLLGIDIGGTNIKIAIIDIKGRIIKNKIFSTRLSPGPGAIIEDISEAVKALIAQCGVSKKDIIGAGAGVPGAVNVKTGTVHYLTNILGWHEVPLAGILKKKLNIPVIIDNDANVMALGEFLFGAGIGADNMLCITLGTGVGGGLVLNGRLYRGSDYAAGEFGHMPINIEGPKCKCGSRACIESYAGSGYIVSDVITKIKKGAKTSIKKLVGGNFSKITPEVISRAANAGDKFAMDVWRDVGRKIGTGLAGVVNLLNLEKIVIGGGLSEAGKDLFDSIKETIGKRAMKLPAKTVRVVKAKLGYDAGAIGAAGLVLYELKGECA